MASLGRGCSLLLLLLASQGSAFQVQQWTYNASLWWAATVLRDAEHGPALAELAGHLTDLTYDMMGIAKAACVRGELMAETQDDSLTPLCPGNGICEIPLMAALVSSVTGTFLEAAGRSLEPLAPELQRIGFELLGSVAHFPEAVPLCHDLAVGLQEEACSPLIFEMARCCRGISELAAATMAQLHTAQVGLVSVRHAEIQVSQPASVSFDASKGSSRSEVLRGLLLEAHQRRMLEASTTADEVELRAAEVGIHDGRTSEFLLQALPSLDLLLVDPFEFADDSYFVEHSVYEDRAAASSLSDRVWERLRPYRNRSVLVLQKSPGAASWAVDGSLDLVFVDAFHGYEAVREDIRAWLPKLRRPGVLAGHDYSLFWPGVCRAVHEFAHDAGTSLMLGADGVWWFHV